MIFHDPPPSTHTHTLVSVQDPDLHTAPSSWTPSLHLVHEVGCVDYTFEAIQLSCSAHIPTDFKQRTDPQIKPLTHPGPDPNSAPTSPTPTPTATPIPTPTLTQVSALNREQDRVIVRALHMALNNMWLLGRTSSRLGARSTDQSRSHRCLQVPYTAGSEMRYTPP